MFAASKVLKTILRGERRRESKWTISRKRGSQKFTKTTMKKVDIKRQTYTHSILRGLLRYNCKLVSVIFWLPKLLSFLIELFARFKTSLGIVHSYRYQNCANSGLNPLPLALLDWYRCTMYMNRPLEYYRKSNETFTRR